MLEQNETQEVQPGDVQVLSPETLVEFAEREIEPPVVVVEEPVEETDSSALAGRAALIARQEELIREIAQIRNNRAAGVTTTQPRNKVASKVNAGRKYVLLAESLNSWGKIPQQQRDIAEILTRSFEVGEEIPESVLFDAVTKLSVQYPSLANSVQDPTDLFRYYRGLDKKDGKHAGYIKRDFLRMVG